MIFFPVLGLIVGLVLFIPDYLAGKPPEFWDTVLGAVCVLWIAIPPSWDPLIWFREWLEK